MDLYTTRRYILLVCSLLASSCLLLEGCKTNVPDPIQDLSTDQMAVVQSLNKVIFPLQDADPNRDFSELAPLDTVMAKAQVIGMGEGTHGTREFFRMKDRLFRYLVQKFGYQTIAFEANFGRSVIVNLFIHGQSSNLATASDAAKSMYFWTWSTDEVRELLQWMKEYNAGKSASQQLSFYGFDCQSADDEFPIVRDFLTKASPSAVSKVDSLASLYKNNSQITDRPTYAKLISTLYNLFVTNELAWATAAGRQEYELAKQAARVLVQQFELSTGDDCTSRIKRDQYMAENVQWMLTTMNVGKVSLWAHSFHMANAPTINCGQPSMGAYLKKALGTKYLVIGTLFTNGSFTVKDVSKSDYPLTALSVHTGDVKGSFNNLFGKVQYANFGLNLNQSRLDTTVSNWLTAYHALFEVGALFNERVASQYYGVTPLKGRYDVLLHFRDTTPTQLLP